jgi:hypothetical protein
MFGISSKQKTEARLEEIVRKTVEAVVNRALNETESALSDLKQASHLQGTISKLQEELETLRIAKARKEEEFAKREREVEHKVGLERKRQEFEIVQAKREATVSIREENLKADRDRFEAQMKFVEERLTQEVTALRGLVKDMMERLPSAQIIANVGKAKS